MPGASFEKDVYPYEYMDSFDKFSEPLPPKESFYSSLDDKHISDKDYQKCLSTMERFKLRTLGDLHNHYVKKDVLPLCDVFEEFRKVCINNYD